MGNIVIQIDTPTSTVVVGTVSGPPGPQGPQGPAGSGGSGSGGYAEPVVIAGFNTSIVHDSFNYSVPLFVTTLDGDIVTTGVS